MPVSPTAALYYPTIDIVNEDWLRTAVLFWEEIRTIVPEGISGPYSSEFARNLHGEGFLTPVSVGYDMQEIEELSDDVLEYLTDPASIGVLFGTADGRSALLHPKKLPRQIRQIAEIHPMKLPSLIREQTSDSLSDRGFVQVDHGFAAYYMTLLAKQLSSRLGLGLVTGSSEADQFSASIRKGKAIRDADIAEHRRIGRYYEATGRRYSIPREIARGALFDLMIDGLKLPNNISAKDLINFREGHAEELSLLRQQIACLVSELPEELSIEALRQGIHDQYTNQVLPALRSLRHSLQARRWDSGLNGFLKVSFFSAASTSALAFLDVSTPMALMAGTGISFTATAMTYVNQRRQELDANPFSYLLTLEKAW